MHNHVYANSLDIAERQAEVLTDAVLRWVKDGASESLTAKQKVLKEFQDGGIRLRGNSPLLQLSNGNAGQGDGRVGVNTFQVWNELIQDFAPKFDESESPLNIMLPFRTVETVTAQQDIISSNYGWAKPSNGVGGAMNAVPLLDVSGREFEGYMYDAISFIGGQALVALRELGSSDTKLRGYLQRISFQQILLMQQVMTAIELMRTEVLFKGSFAYKDSTVSTPIPSANVYTASQSLGTYSRGTNTLTQNPSLTVNLLIEIGLVATQLLNEGLDLAGIVIPNTIYQAIMNSPAITSQTIYTSMNSNNSVQGIRDNLFRLTNIPALQNLDIIVDNRAIKTDANKTNKTNTRPLLYGSDVTTSSFRALFLTRPKDMSRTGYLGFFPNVYNRGTPQGGTAQRAGYGGAISLITQDMSQFNWQNQEIQMLATTCVGPMVSLENSINVFDFNVTVTS